MTKKIWALIVAAALMLGACAALAEETDVTGLWYLTGARLGDQEFSPGMLELSGEFLFYEDGRFELNLTQRGEEIHAAGVWTRDGDTITTREQTEDDPEGSPAGEVIFTLVDGHLEAESDSVTMILTREPEDVVRIPEVIEADDESDFFGTWRSAYVSTDDLMMPAATLDYNMTLTIEAGKATTEVEGDATEEATAFADGVLTSADTETVKNVYRLCDNGMLLLSQTFGEDESSVVMYFEPVQ